MLLAGRYEILELLGAGSWSRTYKACDHHLPGKPLCVVKHLCPREGADWRLARLLFTQEAQVLYRLGEHDRIPRLLAHLEMDGEFYLVQQYIPGEPLSRWIGLGSALGEEQVRRLVRDVLEVLAFIHSQGVIHQDIKPSNLLRRQGDGRIVVIDFGAVRQVCEPRGVVAGTVDYMAPEQREGNPQYSSDLYSLGVVALVALTGCGTRELPRTPEGGYDWQCLGVTGELGFFLGGLLAVDYRQRYRDGQQALAVWQELEAEGPTCMVAVPQRQRYRHWLLVQVHRCWLAGGLSAEIELGFQERPALVSGSLGSLGRIDVPLATFVEQLGPGCGLLVVGPAGCGKTTALRQLARHWHQRAQAEDTLPIPVVFPLRLWPLGVALEDWLVAQLEDTYQLPREVAQDWLPDLHLILDGLDELPPFARQCCVEAINAYRRRYPRQILVVSCRWREYQSLPVKLRLTTAIVLQPLTDRQIRDYIAQVGEAATGLGEMLEVDGRLRQWARCPLLLQLMVATYRHQGATVLLRRLLTEDPFEELLRAYLATVLSRHREAGYSPEQVRQWLGAIARWMSVYAIAEFQVQALQPTFLRREDREIYGLLALVVWGLCGLLEYGVYGGFLLSSCGLYYHFLLPERLDLAYRSRWSWVRARQKAVQVQPWAVAVAGMLACMSTHLTVRYGFGNLFLSFVSLFFVFWLHYLPVVQGVGGVLGGWLGGREVLGEVSLSATVRRFLGWGILALVVLGLGQGFGWLGVVFAGWACRWLLPLVKYGLLRLTVYSAGLGPWNYERFLGVCCQAGILYPGKVGYRFVYPFLQEQFGVVR